MTENPEWERVAYGLLRIVVPGGWLYRTFSENQPRWSDVPSAPVFVPSPFPRPSDREVSAK